MGSNLSKDGWLCFNWEIRTPLQPCVPKGQKWTTYYLSQTMTGVEHRYNPIEKEYLAMDFAMQKIRHYLERQTSHDVSRVNPLKILGTQLDLLNSRLAKWAMLLS